MILVDSSVWIDYFNGTVKRETDLLVLLISREIIIIGDLIRLEVLQGFRTDKDFNTAKKLLDKFLNVNLSNVTIADLSAENYRLLRKKGISVRKTIDVVIATYCIYNTIPLLHSDKDFEPLVKYCDLKIL